MEPMTRKVALVTAGRSGIGRAAALAFARAGVRVVPAARGAARGAEVEREIRAAGGIAIFRARLSHAATRLRTRSKKQGPSIEGSTTPSTMRHLWRSPSR